MSDASDYAAAFRELKRFAQPDSDPVLTYGDGVGADPEMELDSILLEAKRAMTWATETAYVVGEIVMPTARNGHRYRVTQGGTSGATEPTWPTSLYGTVTSGSGSPALTFEEAGSEYSNVYDVRAAKKAVAALKKTKAAHFVGMGQVQFQQLFDHWERIEKQYRGVGVS